LKNDHVVYSRLHGVYVYYPAVVVVVGRRAMRDGRYIVKRLVRSVDNAKQISNIGGPVASASRFVYSYVDLPVSGSPILRRVVPGVVTLAAHKIVYILHVRDLAFGRGKGGLGERDYSKTNDQQLFHILFRYGSAGVLTLITPSRASSSQPAAV